MQSIYEYSFETSHTYELWNIENTRTTKLTIFKPLKEILTTLAPNNVNLLLDEEKFECLFEHIIREQEKVLTYNDLQELVAFKWKEYQKNHNSGAEILHFSYFFCNVNGNSVESPIGHSGKIMFSLLIIGLRHQEILFFKGLYGNQRKSMGILPQSFYTISYCVQSLRKHHFQLLYIYEDYCKLITVQDGRYTTIHKLGGGLKMLKQIYQENGLLAYLFSQPPQMTYMQKEAINHSLQFYVSMLCKRIKEKTTGSYDIVIIGSVLKNSFFIDSFNEYYQKNSHNFIIPFYSSKNLKGLGFTPEPQDTDIAFFLNHLQNRFRKLK